jgi:HemY protein
MLNSLFKILLFLVIVASLAMGATYLMDAQNRVLGNVMITLAGVEYTFSPIQAVMALIALTVVIWLVLKILALLVAILKFINGDETAMSRYFFRNRERKGYQALSEGMLAIASGDAAAAMSKARKAESYLQKPALTNLLAAQAAEMAGDKAKAEQVYKSLLKDPETKFVGVRGLLKQRLADGNTEVALKLAEKAYDLKPRHTETQDVLLQLQAQSADWSGARKTLAAKLKNGTLPRDLHKRRDAVLALSQAKDVIAEGNSIDAREAAIEANKLSPDLVPAACMAARGYIADGKPKLATRVIKKAWASQPHPDLAAAFSEIEPNETPAARLKRFTALAKANDSHLETRLMMAELNLAAEDFPGARRALGDAVEKDPDARVLTIMAAIERGEGSDDTVVRGWLAKTLTARRGPSWVCDKCNTVHDDWAPICDSCDAFDTLSWRVPPSASVATTTGLEMLPLLMGTPASAPEQMDIVPSIIEDADVIADGSPDKT